MTRTATGSARRADALQNAEKIIEAAIVCLAKDPSASVSEIARQGGVGRVTLYGHFATRDTLIEAAVTRLIERGDQALEKLDLSGEPQAALRALISSSWLLLAQSRGVLEAAQAVLPPGRIQELHARPEERVTALIKRGRRAGVFRTDLPVAWMAGILHHMINGAANDVSSERLDQTDAARFITEAVLGAYAPR